MIQYGRPLPIAETKVLADAWEVTGYASTYGNEDLGKDVVVAGAFDRFIDSGAKTRFLYSHRPDRVLGTIPERTSDKAGLKVVSRISQTPLGEEVYTLVKDGALDSFSIGYTVAEGGAEKKDGVRYLKDLNLPEVSLVAMPMNPLATVTAWKSWLELLGVKEDVPLAERIQQINAQLTELLRDTRTVVEAGPRPLNQTKRQELETLLEMLSGLDAARSDVVQLLAAAPTSPVQAKMAFHRLHEMQKTSLALQGE